jgi:hypothetical protein
MSVEEGESGEDLDGGGGARGGGEGARVVWTLTAGARVAWTSTVEVVRCRGRHRGG